MSIQINPNDRTPKYMIGVAAALLGMHPQTLRVYETRGLIRPRRTPGGTRLYSDADLARVMRVTELASGLGLSLQGAEYVFTLEDTIRGLETRVAELEQRLIQKDAEMRREADDIHRSYRHELVLYRQPGTGVAPRQRSA